ncbi:MAG: hypothetical protein Phog2KO_31820 [Phototrophicaceae bacterium]
MREYVAIIGLEEHQSQAIAEQINQPTVSHIILPQIMVKDGQLFVENIGRPKYVPVNKVIFHGIYEDDLDFITGLSFWRGDCVPNPRAMLDLRLKLPGLVRVLEVTRFGEPMRGFASAQALYSSEDERVAKWGNWHCGENKERFSGSWRANEPAVIEHFLEGDAVRIVIIGEQAWQIKLEGDTWLKSIHADKADFMPIDAELLADTQHIKDVFDLQIIANDYIVSPDGSKHLLEVNHIPNVTRFPEIWDAYMRYVIDWANQ